MMLMNDCLLVSTEVSPTPVLLSSPFATASSFLAQNQTLQLLPVSESQTIHSGRRRSNASSSSEPAERKKPFKRTSPYARSSKEERREVRELSPRGRNKKAPHELLTEAEKKANHIASEQKRRQNIRVGFDQLVDIVPTLSQNHRSEAMILQKSVEYIRQLVNIKNDLKTRARDLHSALGEPPVDEDDSSEGEMDYNF
ncbi:hypothetical protein K450DRAFT_229150 [Umbelopsis ramanniana AG]|uniref:BHLH domain-containing protein n=1 Tax=Umbelopsis ramanniana AG TaxID=1314678 RepID=A0AAD5EH37_UMBRA|nr:uncharacterized protein K450DRAFT_229150 [Umbelopsis ramanniana AG]KAI8582130.1 hypothetical protein K450DRAFT_229150 [Umbelopsis ramanniana AG]